MAEEEKVSQLGFRMTAAIAARLEELRDLVRAAGHAKPSQKTMVEALLFAANPDGEELEAQVLVPYRKANADAD